MAKNIKKIQARQLGWKTNDEGVKWAVLDANELKATIRDGLVSMTIDERAEFIGTLEAEMRRAGLNMRSYLVPLGIPGRSTEDLTPTEVAHLIRFLKLNAPQAMRAVERALTQYETFGEKHVGTHRIAA
jgi:hypothetical protein